MKKLFAFMGLIGLFLRGRAQTFAEWFEQNKTEIKYLREQLIALQEEDDVLEDGYAIDEYGLTRIGTIKQDDLNLHTYYFSTLKNVNPAIRADPRVDRILTLISETGKLTARIQEIGDSFPRLQPKLGNMCDDITQLCMTDLYSLGQLLQDGATQLSDARRLERLQKLYEEVKELNGIALGALTDAQFSTTI
jgi:hypothetical protein